MTKQEKIKEAWGECWNKLPNEAQEKAFKNNGFVSQYFYYLLTFDKRERKLFEIRPKSLQGIEINNGWIKIESKDDLPKIDGHYWVVDKNETSTRIIRYTNDPYTNQMKNDWWMKYITHYQTIEVPSPPIY